MAAAAAGEDDAAAIKEVRAAAIKVRSAASHGCPTLAKAALPDMEAQFAALSDDDKKRMEREVKAARSSVENMESWTAETLIEVVNQTLMKAEYGLRLGSLDGNTLRDFDENVQAVTDQLGDEVNKKLLPADKAEAFTKRLDAVKAEGRKKVVKHFTGRWKEQTQYIAQKHAGWEKETEARKIAEFIKEHEPGCDESVAVVSATRNFLEDGLFVAALARYPDAAELTKLRDDATAIRDKAVANVKRVHEQLLAQAEKLPPGDQREHMAALYRGRLPHEGFKWQGPVLGDEDLVDRMKAFVTSANGEAAQRSADKKALMASLVQAADDAWPGYLSKWKLESFEATQALEKPDAWKGKTVKFFGRDLGGGTYEASYGLVVEIDGVPVCGNYADAIVAECRAFEAKTGIQVTEHQEYVGIVSGTCKVWERVKDPRDSKKTVRGRQVDGVKMNIVGLKSKGLAVAAGFGSSLDKVGDSASSSSESSSRSSSGSSAPSGKLHFVHRLVAWASSALLLLVGLLTLGHGASRFVPQLQQQKAKLGDYLGYAGVAFVALGGLWFGASAVLPIFSGEVRFGSLPAIALGFAGLSVALDLARAKGKIEEKTALLLQPVAIVFGLGCFLAAVVHVVGWDMPLL